MSSLAINPRRNPIQKHLALVPAFFVCIVSRLLSLIVFVPSLAVTVRRMHDVGKSGWFILIPFYNIILLVTDSVNGENEYGHSPK